MDISFFTADPADPSGATVVPTDLAVSSWGADHLHGVAVCGALARGAERALAATGRTDLRPARMSVDLFRPARRRPARVVAEVVRASGRLCLVDVTLLQDDEPVARAAVLHLRPDAPAEGAVWGPDDAPAPPPEALAPPTEEPRVPFLGSAGRWSQDFREHQNDARKTSWNSAVPVVAGEPLTPFQAVAATADGASLVTNWGTAGVEHINTDVTLLLARLPVGTEVGLHALHRVESDGIATGSAVVFDRAGVVGSVALTSLVNARKAIDLAAVAYDDDGTRHEPAV